MYDPFTARFLQEDTYTGDPNDPLSLNLYTYVKNNPLMYWDPTGHKWVRTYTGFETWIPEEDEFTGQTQIAPNSDDKTLQFYKAIPQEAVRDIQIEDSDLFGEAYYINDAGNPELAGYYIPYSIDGERLIKPDFWHNGEFFQPLWWHDDEKAALAFSQLERDALTYGDIDIRGLGSNKQQALQALVSATNGENGTTERFVNYVMDSAVHLNTQFDPYALSSSDINELAERQFNLYGREFKKVLENGLGDVINGGLVIAYATVSQVCNNSLNVKAAEMRAANQAASNAARGVNGYTRHGLNQVIGRDGGVGVKPKAIQDAVKNPVSITEQVRGGRISYQYQGKDAVVVVNSAGEVITAWPTNSSAWRGGF